MFLQCQKMYSQFFPVYFFINFIGHLMHEYIYLSCLKIWEHNCWRIVIARANLWGVQILCFKRWNFRMTNKVLANLHTFNNSNFKLQTLGEWAYLAGRVICALNFNVHTRKHALNPRTKMHNWPS